MNCSMFSRSAVITLQCMETALLDWLVPSGEQEPQNDTVIFVRILSIYTVHCSSQTMDNSS